MPLQKYIFTPGINKEGTEYSNSGGWFDSNLMRFRKGLPEKIGGWTKATGTTFLSTARAIHAWVDNDGTRFIGLGTTWKYYAVEGQVYYDITPIRATTTNGIVFAATNGSSTITATDSSHQVQLNDFVTLSGAVSLGGLITATVLNQEYQVTSAPTANTFTFTAKDTSGNTVTANSSDSGNGGSAADAAYQIGVGLDVYVPSTGWGSDYWGAGTWGSVSALGANSQLRIWSHDNFGEDLIMNVRGAGIFYHDVGGGVSNRAVALSDLTNSNLAPTVALQVLVSDIDRHVICFGADAISPSGVTRTNVIDPMLVAWSDQENAEDWEPRATNTAGSFRLSAGSSIIGAIRARQETLIWTDTSLYSMSFVGQPFVFAVNLVNEGVGLVGPNAAVNTPKGVFWMDKKGFYSYTGGIQQVPCTVDEYVFTDLNQTQSYQIFSFVNKAFDEVGWFYCSGTSNVIDRYVVFNYEENVWTIGKLSRSCWLDEGVFPSPKATFTDVDYIGYLYDHETGYDDDGSAMTDVYIESSDFNIDPAGEDFQSISRIIPDIKFTGEGDLGSDGQTLDIVLKRRNFPGESLITSLTTACTSVTTKIDTRVRGRQAVLRVQSNDADVTKIGTSFRVGATRMDFKPDGKR